MVPEGLKAFVIGRVDNSEPVIKAKPKMPMAELIEIIEQEEAKRGKPPPKKDLVDIIKQRCPQYNITRRNVFAACENKYGHLPPGPRQKKSAK